MGTGDLAMTTTESMIDLRGCKAEARRLLAPGHPVRVVLEAEPDMLDAEAAAGRLPLLMRMVLAHRRKPR